MEARAALLVPPLLLGVAASAGAGDDQPANVARSWSVEAHARATRTFYPHEFPAPHIDAVESFIDYREPTETVAGPIQRAEEPTIRTGNDLLSSGGRPAVAVSDIS